MPKVIMTCGLICCGKSTYAGKIREEGNAVILSVDDITLALFPEGLGDRHDAYVRRVEDCLLELSLQILRTGADVILDWGLWTKSERDITGSSCCSGNSLMRGSREMKEPGADGRFPVLGTKKR